MKITLNPLKPKKNTNELNILAFRGHTQKLLDQLTNENSTLNIYKANDEDFSNTLLWALYGRRLDIVDILLNIYETDLEAIKCIQPTNAKKVYMAYDEQIEEVIKFSVKSIEHQPELPEIIHVMLKRTNTTIPECVSINLKEASRNPSFEELLKVLYDNGTCDLNARINQKQDTLLHIASYFGYQHIVERLLNLGADHRLINIHNQTALWYALYTGQLEISMKLACLPDVIFWQRDKSNNFLARAAACSGKFRVFEYIIDKMLNDTGLAVIWSALDCLLYEPCSAGENTFHEIARRGHFQLVKESRAIISMYEQRFSKPNNAGETALHLFCQLEEAKHTENLLKFVRKYPGLLSIPRNDGKLPIDVMASVHGKHLKLFQQLMDENLKTNIQND
jgi:ankyrin repeat protein